MSDTAPKPTDTSAQSSGPTLENVKGEFTRKIGTIESQMTELAKTNAALLKQIESLRSPQPTAASKEKSIEDLLYDDPRQAVEKITQNVRTTLKKELDTEQAIQRKQNQAINELYAEFPEFSDNEHALTKKALEVYGKMEDAEKSDPKALKLAAYQAAVELDVKPKSRRGDDDSFTFGGAPSGNRPRKDSTKLDPAVEAFAQAMGMDTSKPEVVAKLKARQK